MVESIFWLASQYYGQKLPVAEIAKLADTSVGEVVQLLWRYQLMRISDRNILPPLNENEVWLRQVITIEKRTITEVAALCGCSPEIIRGCLATFKIRAPDDLEKPSAVSMMEGAGLTAEAIAAAYHLPLEALLDWRKIEERDPLIERAKVFWLQEQANKNIRESEIAALAQTTPAALRRFLRKYAIPTVDMPARAWAHKESWVVDQIAAGQTLQQIAAACDCNVSVIMPIWKREQEREAIRIYKNTWDARVPWIREQVLARVNRAQIAQILELTIPQLEKLFRFYEIKYVKRPAPATPQKNQSIRDPALHYDPIWLTEQLLQHKTLAEMSATAGVSEKQVVAGLRKTKLIQQYRKQQRFYDNPDWLSERLKAGHTYREMAAEANISQAMIQTLVKKYNLRHLVRTR